MEILVRDNRKVIFDMDMLIVSIWNKYVDIDEKIYINDKEFFDNNFKNPYDAVWAVEMGNWKGNWKYSDTFVIFDDDGYITSFRHWDDENSPIKIDRVDVGHLIKQLQEVK